MFSSDEFFSIAAIDADNFQLPHTKFNHDKDNYTLYLSQTQKYIIHQNNEGVLFVYDKLGNATWFKSCLKWNTGEDYENCITSMIEVEDNNVIFAGTSGFIGVLNLDSMTQPFIIQTEVIFDKELAMNIVQLSQ